MIESPLPQPNIIKPTIWETNPKLKLLLLVLIFVFLFSGVGLVVFAQWSNNYRQQVYEQTQAALPKHVVNQTASQSASNQLNSDKQTDTSGWKIYTNDKYGFKVQYLDGVEIGNQKQSINLGTYQNPVYGIDIGGGVLVPLESSDIKTKAQNIIKQMESYIGLPVPGNGDIPPPNCTKQDINNTSVKVEGVYCLGEGGPAYYVYITGSTRDFFYDGYASMEIDKETANKIFATFKFTPIP